jgi:hypothetical protein
VSFVHDDDIDVTVVKNSIYFSCISFSPLCDPDLANVCRSKGHILRILFVCVCLHLSVLDG